MPVKNRDFVVWAFCLGALCVFSWALLALVLYVRSLP